jgi:hypothetical protein
VTASLLAYTQISLRIKRVGDKLSVLVHQELESAVDVTGRVLRMLTSPLPSKII